VYVIDSILKNVKGFYISVIQEDAEKWLPIVSSKLDDEQRSRLKKVWQTWNEAHLFDVDKWKAMGRCFNAEASSGNPVAVSVLQPVAGIARMVSHQETNGPCSNLQCFRQMEVLLFQASLGVRCSRYWMNCNRT